MPTAASQPHLTSAWEAWCATFADRVQGLADEQSLTVTAPESLARPAKPKVGLVKRVLGQTYENAPAWVKVLRRDDLALAVCVSDAREIGFPLSPEEKAALAGLGWRPGGITDEHGLLRWFPDDVPSGPFLPTADARALAHTVAATMRDVFGVNTPTDLSLARP